MIQKWVSFAMQYYAGKKPDKNGHFPPLWNDKIALYLSYDWLKDVYFLGFDLFFQFCLYVAKYFYLNPIMRDTTLLSNTWKKLWKILNKLQCILFFSAFVTSCVMEKVNERLGRKITAVIGAIVGLVGCLWLRYGCAPGDPYVQYHIFFVAILLGKLFFAICIFNFS